MIRAGAGRSAWASFLVGLVGLLAGCAERPTPPEGLTLTPVEFAALPGWPQDRLGEAVPALRRSCVAFAAEAGERLAGPAGTALRAADWRAPCKALAALADGDDGAARGFFESWFRAYRAGNAGSAEGLFTGYYEPELRGSRQPDGRHIVPLYGRPADLVTVQLGEFDDTLRGKHIAGRLVGGALKPYPSRAEIEAGALKEKAPALLWVDDPIDAFFLQVQGSGRIRLKDGTLISVGYAAENGRRYRSIGKLLVERGALSLEEASLQSIKAWLRQHPDEAQALMNEDAAYVFFRELPGADPIGAQGVALTPGRSLAVDPRFLSFGLPVWLDIEDPAAPPAPVGVSAPRLRRLVIAQDAGSAIKGPVRGDLFWGAGAEAELTAGHMRSRGSYYILLPRNSSAAAWLGTRRASGSG